MTVFMKDLSFEIPIIYKCCYYQPKRFFSENHFSDLANQKSENLLLTFQCDCMYYGKRREMFGSREFGCF